MKLKMPPIDNSPGRAIIDCNGVVKPHTASYVFTVPVTHIFLKGE